MWALKHMFGLPPTTPNAAVRYVSGTLFIETRIQQRQLMFFHSLLQKEQGHRTLEALSELQNYNIGWTKKIDQTLASWELENDWSVIKTIPQGIWKRLVYAAAEKWNKKKLVNECQTKQRGVTKNKTKTVSILEQIEKPNYIRQPLPILRELTCVEMRALVMGRYGMLDCRANFSAGYGNKQCLRCDVEDNEVHRMNECPLYGSVNRVDSDQKVDFEKIYSDSIDDVRPVIDAILEMWDLEHGKNKMRT